MGIKGLLSFLSNSFVPCHIKEFKNCTVAIDAHGWLHKAVHAFDVGVSHNKACVDYVIRRIHLLLKHGIQPILVFDGCVLPNKTIIHQERKRLRENNLEKAKFHLSAGDIEKARKFQKYAAGVSNEMVFDVIKECRKLGIDTIVAPYEADAQLAFFSKSGVADLIITEDSDVLVYGALKVLYKMNQEGGGQLISAEDINNSLQLNSFSHDKFQFICIMAGCDYLKNIEGIGLSRATKFINTINWTQNTPEHKLISEIASQYSLSEEYMEGFKRAYNTFKYHVIFDPTTRGTRPLEAYPEGQTSERFAFAGQPFSHSYGIQLALGNIAPGGQTFRSSFDPHHASNDGKLRHGSIWRMAEEQCTVPVVSRPASDINATNIDINTKRRKTDHQSNNGVKTPLQFQIKKKYRNKSRLGTWEKKDVEHKEVHEANDADFAGKSFDNPLEGCSGNSASGFTEEVHEANETDLAWTSFDDPLEGGSGNNTSGFAEELHMPAEFHYAYLVSYGNLLQTPYDMLSNDLWETVVFFPNYCAVKRYLKVDDYIFVKRRPMKFQLKWQWVYSCQCDSVREKFVHSLNYTYELPCDQVVVWPQCIHIRCAQKLLSSVDREYNISPEGVHGKLKSSGEHSYSQMSNKVRLCQVNDCEDKLAVLTEDGTRWGVCGIQFTHSDEPEARIRCLTCKKYDCQHAVTLTFHLPLARDDDSPLALFKRSMENISRTEESAEKYHQDRKVPLYPQAKENIPDWIIASTNGLCTCGHHWSDSQRPNEQLLQSVCIVYCESSVKPMKVYQRECSSLVCNKTKKYDSLPDNMIYSGTHAFSHAVLFDYLRHFLTEGLTMHHYYQTYVHKMTMLGYSGDVSSLHYGKFRKSWLRFMRCLDLDYEEGFECPSCQKQPEVVVFDGICLGMQKTYLKARPVTQEQQVQLTGSSFDTRNFIKVKQGRTLLKDYCLNEGSDTRFLELQQMMKSYQPSLLPLLNELADNGQRNECPQNLKAFLLALSQDSPVCALVPQDEDVLDLLELMSDGYDPREKAGTDLKLLQMKTPFLFKLITTFEEIPASLRPILTELIDKSMTPFKGKCHELPPPQTENPTGYFPSLPVLCQRGSYVLDTKQNPSEKGLSCQKTPSKRGHKTLTPGLFILNCQHGVCYGFDLMMNYESPDMAFTLLRTRFRKAPRIVIYDNGCKLHQYCLNRDPDFFRYTKFVVDRLHWKNHRGCSEAYNMDLYPGMETLNSQVAEQRNSQIKPLSSSLSYMTHDNFVLALSIHTIHRNYLHIASSFPETTFRYQEHFQKLVKVYCK